MEKTPNTKKEWPPFRPSAYGGGNLIIGGLSYILLRQYKRFFLLYGIGTALTLLGVGDAIFLLVILSVFDAHIIASKLKKKEIPEPPHNTLLAVLSSLVLVGIVSLLILTVVMAFMYPYGFI
ncbi:hypothetical protein GOV11_05420 [Candidatus Woesearchaeota archaeon]|nr:hypothetical protein [Candidatus Woesearchaeota archaeon]